MQGYLDWNTAIEVLERAPVGVLLLRQRSIVWVNDGLARTLQTSKDVLIGLTSESATECGLLPLFEQIDRFRITQTDGAVRWFKRQAQALGDAEIIFFSDITERVALEEQCAQLEKHVLIMSTKDPVTGLLNQTATLQALEQQVTRSRRYGNPLALIRIAVASGDPANDAQATLRAIGQEINAQLRWADLIGRWEGDAFLIVLPETGLDDARRLAAKLLNDRLPTIKVAVGWTTTFACAAWTKGDDAKRLLERLDGAEPYARLN